MALKTHCIGGGPAGLYFAISMKLCDPAHDVCVIERNRASDTFGWGVVFSDQTMDRLTENDPVSAQEIFRSFSHWDDIDVHYKGKTLTSGGHGFAGIGRQQLLQILQDRAASLGVKLLYEQDVCDIDAWRDADLVIASDGLNSIVREQYAQTFRPNLDLRHNRFVWYGTTQVFDAFTFLFKETEHGWIWAHAYRFDQNTSTFIVECAPDTWTALGLDTDDNDASMSLCESLFADHLNGNALMSNATHMTGCQWRQFPRVTCETWRHENIVLMGDAAHTAHFSIGSGTKLALEDAITLSQHLNEADYPSVVDAVDAYQDVRHLEVLKLQSAARNSTEWFENLNRYAHFEPVQFTYALLTRSQRVSHENLRVRDETWVNDVERWFAANTETDSARRPVPPMFTPFSLRAITLNNRIVVSPMSMYSAVDGTPNDFHLVHYGARAQGGAGLIYTEMTNISANARITPGCTGLYNDAHVDAWRRITRVVHQSQSKIALQLGHAGPKGSTRVAWDGMDQPLEDGNWSLLAPSAIPWSPANQVPAAMTEDDMQAVEADFVAATDRAIDCGFDLIELHAAHGYLLSAFITPLTNHRDDEYGGTLNNRLRFPLRIFNAIRAVWPDDKPMAVRVSAHDWLPDGSQRDDRAQGITADDSVDIAKAFKAAGADVIDVSAGQTSIQAKPVYGRMFQTPFSDQIRNEAHIATMAVGNIFEVDHVNSILAAGRADLVCLGRPHLSDPYWTLRAAAEQGYTDVAWPKPYVAGQDQLERLKRRERESI